MGRFGVTYRVDRAKVPFSVSADDPAVKALIDTYNEFTGKHVEPFAMGGGTYARNFARAVSFGPRRPAWSCPMGRPDARPQRVRQRRAAQAGAQDLYRRNPALERAGALRLRERQGDNLSFEEDA